MALQFNNNGILDKQMQQILTPQEFFIVKQALTDFEKDKVIWLY